MNPIPPSSDATAGVTAKITEALTLTDTRGESRPTHFRWKDASQSTLIQTFSIPHRVFYTMEKVTPPRTITVPVMARRGGQLVQASYCNMKLLATRTPVIASEGVFWLAEREQP
jgi:hypothetical protein